MLDSEVEALYNHHSIPWLVPRRNRRLEQEKGAISQVSLLDEVPVMSATVLGLEMLLHASYCDLRMVSDLILSDFGATFQILRMVAGEYEFAAERPRRMVDCIASLEVESWLPALSARTFICGRQHAAMTAAWKHFRLVAQYSQLVAASTERISPEDAYLVGLLHGIETIPELMGWAAGNPGIRGRYLFQEMESALPPFVLAALDSLNDLSTSSVWKFVLTAAHDLASSEADAFAPAESIRSTVCIG